MKTNNSFSKQVFIYLTIQIISLFSIMGVTAQDWFDVNWQYRRPVSVQNQGAASLSDFQVKITLDNSFDFNKTKSDGSDIRLTNEDGITLIPYWIENWDNVGEQAVIWVKIPGIPASEHLCFCTTEILTPQMRAMVQQHFNSSMTLQMVIYPIANG
jgi:biopolymer transport protein ExbB